MMVLENVKNIIAIEYMCAAQGLDLLSPLKTSDSLARAHAAIRERVSVLEDDRELSPDIMQIRELMDSGDIVSAVETVAGSLFDD
jgi:histidine ammonia-lyase